MLTINSTSMIHVVLFSFRQNVSISQRLAAVEQLKTAGKTFASVNDGLEFWQVSENLDQRKEWHVIEVAIFANRVSFADFQASEQHNACVDMLRDIADWVTGDLEAANQLINM